MKILLRSGWLAFIALPFFLNAQSSPNGAGPNPQGPGIFAAPFQGKTSAPQRKLNFGLSSRFHSHGEFPAAGLTPTLDVYYGKFALQIMPAAPRTYIGLMADIADFKKLRIKDRECLHLIAYAGYSRSDDDYKPWFNLDPYPDLDVLHLGSGVRFTLPDRAFFTAGLSMDFSNLRQEYEVLYPRSLQSMYVSAFVGLGFTIFPMHQISSPL